MYIYTFIYIDMSIMAPSYDGFLGALFCFAMGGNPTLLPCFIAWDLNPGLSYTQVDDPRPIGPCATTGSLDVWPGQVGMLPPCLMHVILWGLTNYFKFRRTTTPAAPAAVDKIHLLEEFQSSPAHAGSHGSPRSRIGRWGRWLRAKNIFDAVDIATKMMDLDNGGYRML